MAHDLWVGVIRGEKNVTPQEQVKAARIATGLVGALAIVIGIAAKGQNVARFGGAGVCGGGVGELSMRIADAVLETLQHRRHRPRDDRRHADRDRARPGIAEHDLPQADQGGGAEGRRCRAGKESKLTADLAAATDDAAKTKTEKALVAMQKEVAIAKGKLDKFANEETSLVGLDKPLFDLRNPGLISIPLGFLAVILGSLLYRDKRAEDMWDELYVRQNTGILAAKAAAH